MSKPISSTLSHQPQSETDTETRSRVSSPSSIEQSSTSEEGSEKSAQAPVMKTRQNSDASPTTPATHKINSSAPSQAAMTSSLPTMTNRPTIEERKARYRESRNFLAHSRDIVIKREKTVKQGGAAGIQQAPEPDGRWDLFKKAVSVEGKLVLNDPWQNEMSELVAWLRTSPASLRCLKISGYVVDANTTALAEALRNNTTLITLNLSSNEIGDEGAVALANLLQTNHTLTDLNLFNNWIGERGISALAKVLLVNRTLTTLNLSGNTIGVPAARYFATVLKFNTTLTSISLSNFLSEDGIPELAEALHVNKKLTTIELGANRIGVDSAAALSEALRKNQTLTTLDLNGNHIDAYGTSALAQALQANRMLATLNLCRNQIGDVGAKALAEVLQGRTTLKTLDLSYNNIDYEGVEKLAEALQSNATLTMLNLSGNKVDCDGAEKLAEALQSNTTLTMLYLSGGKIHDRGVKKLANTLRINSTLTMLDLSYNEYWSVRPLISALKFNTKMTILKVNSDVDPALKKEIDNLLERNKEQLLTYAEASLDLLVRHSPLLNNLGVPRELLPLLAGQLSHEVLKAFGQEWQKVFSASAPPVITTTTNATVTTTTTTTTDSTIPTTLITSPAALTTDSASSPPPMTQPTATAADINALLADPNPVVALSRWIDGHANPTAALNWVDPSNGYTLLHYAVVAQQGAVVRSLLAHGIDRTRADQNNQTAAQLAQRLAGSSSSSAVAAIAALFK